MTPFSSNTTLSAKNSQIVACPNCYAKFRFYRTNRSHIDVSSSENYRLECMRCEMPLVGVIDSAGNGLLLLKNKAGLH
jgi:hypothetical protein